MKRKEILRRLEERLARGEISEKTYLEIKARYESEPEEPEEETAESPAASLEEAIAEVTQEATVAAEQAARAVSVAMRAVDFTGGGARLSDEMIKIVGSGVVTGNPVRTQEFKCAGSGRVRGNLEAQEAHVAGSCVFEGDVHVGEFRSSGSSQVSGSLTAEEVEASGSLQVAKDVQAQEVVTSGSLSVGGEVTTTEFRSSGAVRIAGGLRAQEVVIDLGGTCSIRSIEAAEIRVKATGAFSRLRGDLTSERIQGHEVALEGTSAALVVGEEVRIGPHCRIDVVEARDLVVHESSEVKERRLPPS